MSGTRPQGAPCRAALLLLAAIALLWAACTDEPTETSAVLGSISDVDNWNPYVAQQSFAHDLLRRIYLRLAEEQGDGRDHPPSYEPQLAESWSFSDDRLSLTFILRDARWSDGQSITANDVRFTWQAQTAPEVAWVSSPTKEHVTDVEVVDERTVVFHFDRPYPYQFADAVEGLVLPEHVFGQVPFGQWRSHDWSQVNVAAGPFLLDEYRPADQIVLVRNPRYFLDGLPNLDRVVVRIVPDSGNLLTQLLSGDIDYMEGISPREAQRVHTDSDITITPFDQPKYDFIGWNAARPPLDDSMVRRALTLAIDRQALLEDLLYSFGRVSAGPVLSFWWGANKDLVPWPYDPKQALRILADRGYRPRDEDGVLVRDGRPLELRLITNAGRRLREAMLVKIQEQLRQIGVIVEVQLLEMRAMRQQVVSGDYDAYLGGWVFSGKVDLKSIFGSSYAPPNGLNVVAYHSGEVDRLLEQLVDAEDWRQMKPTLDAIQLRIHEDQPYTFLYETQRLAVSGPRLHGVEIPIPSDPLARLERYWVKP